MTDSALHVTGVGVGAAAISEAEICLSRDMPGLIRRVRLETPKDKKQAPNPREETRPSWPTAGDQLQSQAQPAPGPLHRLFPSPITVPLTFT